MNVEIIDKKTGLNFKKSMKYSIMWLPINDPLQLVDDMRLAGYECMVVEVQEEVMRREEDR